MTKPNPYLIDDENPEWTAEELAQAKWGYEFFTSEQLADLKLAQQKMRDTRLAKETKLVSVKIENAIVERFKASGEGWQARMNEVLKKASAV